MPALLRQQTCLSIEKILFTTNFSAPAENALPYAAMFARHYGSQVYVGHAFPPPLRAVSGGGIPVRCNCSRDEAQHAMDSFLRTAPLRGLRVKRILRKGPHELVFADMVKTLKIDLVVAATHGGSSFKKLLLGSVAEDIFRPVSCSALIVGPNVTPWGVVRGAGALRFFVRSIPRDRRTPSNMQLTLPLTTALAYLSCTWKPMVGCRSTIASNP